MKHYKSILCLIFAALTSAYAKPEKPHLDDLIQDFHNLRLPTIPLEFATLLKSKPDAELFQKKRSRLLQLQQEIDQTKSIDVCDKIKSQDLQVNVKIGLELLQLLNHIDEKGTNFQGSISTLSNGTRWYQLLTLWWLGQDITTDILKEIGQQHFSKAYSEFLETKSHVQSGKSKKTHLTNKAIMQAYLDAQNTVSKEIGKYFEALTQIAPLKIDWSDFGDTFPAPGYYDLNSGTFFINLLSDYDNQAQIDWLFLHEGMPGHHYQYQMSKNNDTCIFESAYRPNMAFGEGWAAYVETLGSELGLYQNSERKLAALKWESLRAFRVLVDVGIHHQGWTFDEAKKYWIKHFPDGTDVMEREIKRIQRWPMQVNTYVYGKHRIELLKKNEMESSEFNIKKFHQNVLALSHLPLFSFDFYAEYMKH